MISECCAGGLENLIGVVTVAGGGLHILHTPFRRLRFGIGQKLLTKRCDHARFAGVVLSQ